MYIFLLREYSPSVKKAAAKSQGETKKSPTKSERNESPTVIASGEHTGVEFYSSGEEYIDDDTVEFVRREDNEHAIS